MDLGGPRTNLLLRLLSASSERARVIAGNLGNQNTPGYQRRDVQFESLLQEELVKRAPHLDEVRAELVVDTDTTGRPDGNNVVVEEEVSAMRENLLRYQLYATILRGQAKLIQSAIHGDR
jgi:flagellar basal-body rod protein FlgB